MRSCRLQTDDRVVRDHNDARMAFIQKPFTPTVLLQTIRDLLDA